MRLSRCFRMKQATGVAVGEGRLVAVTLGSMPAAAREIGADEQEIGEGGIATALAALHERGALAGTVVVGLDPRSAFFMTRERPAGAELDVTQMVDSYFAAGRPEGGLVADAVPVSVRGGNYVALAACRRVGAEQVQAGLSNVPHTRRALEPTPFAVFRLAQRAAPAPSGWKAVIRVTFDGHQGLALLQRGRSLLAWRPFSAAPGHELDGIAEAVRGLVAHGRCDLRLTAVDGVLLHASANLAGVAAQAAGPCGLEIRLVAAVATDPRSIAQGLALGALGGGASAPDLLKQLRPPPTVREIFPWVTATLLTAAALGAWQKIAAETASYDARIRRAQTTLTSAMKASRVKPSELKVSMKAATHEAALASRFIGGRVPWAALLAELPAHLPESTVLIGIMGHDQCVLPSLDRPDEKVSLERELSLQGQVRMSREAAAPADVKELLTGITEFPLLVTNFPRVDGAEVTRHPQKGEDTATFIVRCGANRK
ncbi:MAG: hypothetical protein K8T90_22475 [Planctomycetes bacterium]|nr:hypothetical protein [Planctomycetota bacterium]